MKLVKIQREILANAVKEFEKQGVAKKPVTVAPSITSIRQGGFSNAYSKYCLKMEQLLEANYIHFRGGRRSSYAYLNVDKLDEIKALLTAET